MIEPRLAAEESERNREMPETRQGFESQESFTSFGRLGSHVRPLDCPRNFAAQSNWDANDQAAQKHMYRSTWFNLEYRRMFSFDLVCLSLQAYARLAFIFLVVHVAGGLVLTAFYYNFTAFEVYIMALFWAMIVSIPLYQVKMTIIGLIFHRLLRETYDVLDVVEDKPRKRHKAKHKVQLRRLSRFRWFCADETEPEEHKALNMNGHNGPRCTAHRPST